jgi:hypothetical protein
MVRVPMLRCAAAGSALVCWNATAEGTVSVRAVVLSTDMLPTPESSVSINSLGVSGRPWATINDAGEVAFIATAGPPRSARAND